MLVFSYQAGSKYRRMFDFIASGTDPLNTDEMAGKLTRKFDELDMDGDQKIGSLEVVKLAEMSGRKLSNAERHVKFFVILLELISHLLDGRHFPKLVQPLN